MATAATPASLQPRSAWYGTIPALALHTLIVYTLAVHISRILVGRWFAWVLPAFQFHSSVASRDWYLQHVELVTILPALIAGYVNVARFLPTIVGGQVRESTREPAAAWAWIVPTLVLVFKMAQYHAPSSVLYVSTQSAFRYFFEIERHMPSWDDLVHGNFGNDPARIAAQLFVTAPFYAGIAYTAGALSSRYQLVQRLFTSDQSGAPLLVSTLLGHTTPEPPSSSPD